MRAKPLRPFILILTLISLTTPLFAQLELPETTIRTTVSEVVVPVTVQNRRGNFVNGLEARDFRLYDNDKLQDITMDVTYSPISMVVAIQCNNDVGGMLPHVQKIGNMLDALVIGQYGEAMLVAFDHRMRVIQDWTNDGEKFSQALEGLWPGSSTSAMIDAVFFGVRQLRRRPADQRRILLLISEVNDKGSEGALRDALREAEFHNVIVYTININRGKAMWTKDPQVRRSSPYPAAATPLPGYAPQTPSSVERLRGQQSMTFIPMIREIFVQTRGLFVPNKAEVFTRYTGGREFGFDGLKDLERALTDLGEELHSQYILSYQPDGNTEKEAGYHEIHVDVNRPNLEVRARQGYWAAARYAQDTDN
jgi:VWFA-related protein